MVTDDIERNLASILKSRIHIQKYRLYGIGFVIMVAVFAVYPFATGDDFFLDVSVNASTQFIGTNIEVLVGTFAVTMGVTLLGMQFRSQAYALSGLQEYIRDKPTYMFITLFLGTIVANMIVISTPGLNIQVHALPYLILGTAYLLVYLVEYVYYMVRTLEPREVLYSLETKLERFDLAANISGYDDNSVALHNFQAYHVWTQTMYRAIETNNMDLFASALDMIFKNWSKFSSENPPSPFPPKIDEIVVTDHIKADLMHNKIDKFFEEHIIPIMLACVQSGRNRFTFLFMLKFEQNEKSDNPVPSNMIAMLWYIAMTEAFRHHNYRVVWRGVVSYNRILSSCGRKGIESWFMVQMDRLLELADSQNYDEFLTLYFQRDDFSDFMSLKSWRNIVLTSIHNRDLDLFEEALLKVPYPRTHHCDSGSFGGLIEKKIGDLTPVMMTIMKTISSARRSIDAETYFDTFLNSYLSSNQAYSVSDFSEYLESHDITLDPHDFVSVCNMADMLVGQSPEEIPGLVAYVEKHDVAMEPQLINHIVSSHPEMMPDIMYSKILHRSRPALPVWSDEEITAALKPVFDYIERIRPHLGWEDK